MFKTLAAPPEMTNSACEKTNRLLDLNAMSVIPTERCLDLDAF